MLACVAVVAMIVLKRKSSRDDRLKSASGFESPHPVWMPTFAQQQADYEVSGYGARAKELQNHYSEPGYVEGISNAENCNNTIVKLDGWLFKLARGKSRLGRTNWKKRYFQLTQSTGKHGELTGCTLAYYDQANHNSNTPTGIRKGIISLDDIIVRPVRLAPQACCRCMRPVCAWCLVPCARAGFVAGRGSGSAR